MDALKIGEMATLENGKEYIVFYQTIYEECDYVYLLSNFKPLEMLFAKQLVDDQGVALEIITDVEIKQKLLSLLQEESVMDKINLLMQEENQG